MYQLNSVLREIKNCQHCLDSLPYGTRPILQAKNTAKILIVGQAPGIKVHKTGIPWNDRSGERLRYWMNVSSNQFYDQQVEHGLDQDSRMYNNNSHLMTRLQHHNLDPI